MSWQALVDVAGILLGSAGLVASVASYFQSEKAATEAGEAKRNAERAAEQSAQAIELIRQELERGTILGILGVASSMAHELESHFITKTYPSVLIRSRDMSKELVYLIGRWGEKIPGPSLAAIAEVNAKIEQLRDRLQQLPTVTEKEHTRLLGTIQPIVKSIDNEHAQAQKRKEENGRKL